MLSLALARPRHPASTRNYKLEKQMNRRILRRLVPAMSVAALLLAVPGHVSAAPISDHSHESLSDSFPEV